MLNVLMCTLDFFQQFYHYIQLLMHIIKFVKIPYCTACSVFLAISNIFVVAPLLNSSTCQPFPNVS
jgi:hypothetical protein